VSLYKQEPGIQGMYKVIAKAGHVCYASDKEDDGEEFVKRCIKLGHMRPLEFGTIYLKIQYDNDDATSFYANDPYSRMYCGELDYYVTTNYRVLVENDRESDLQYWCEPTAFHDLRHCIFWEHIGRDTADEFRTHTSLNFWGLK